MDFYLAVVKFFQTGGPFMVPIALVLTLGIVIAVERWIFLTSARVTNKLAFDKMAPFIQHRKYDQLASYARSSSAPVSRIVAAGVESLSYSQRRDDVVSAMQEAAMQTVPRLEKRTGYLATLANVATLLGLLGTIIGLISAFTAVADADPAQKASLLSQSISVAMNTTAFGLISAIPLLLFHALLQSKTNQIVESLDIVGVKFMNSLAARGDVGNQSRKDDTPAASRQAA
jgi:biopolymer transport protein ExbB/TolQ